MSMRAQPKPTIVDIAREAGVSKGTVSRVLNGHTTVAARTREQVNAVIARLGYAPDPAARHLSWRSGHTLGLSLDKDDPALHPYQVLFRRALDQHTAPQGVQVLELRAGLADLGRLPSAVLVMHARDGDPRLAQLRARQVPTVLVGHQPGVFWVAPDDLGGARAAAEHLLGVGHRHLAYVGRGDSQVQQDREAGFAACASAAGARVTALPCDFTALGGYRAVRASWERGERFSALFAQSDECAMGAITALSDLGLRVPEDVSVVGFDGLPEVTGDVRLTSVAQDIPRIVSTALTLMQEAIAGQAPRGEFIPVELVPGATVAPPPGGMS